MPSPVEWRKLFQNTVLWTPQTANLLITTKKTLRDLGKSPRYLRIRIPGVVSQRRCVQPQQSIQNTVSVRVRRKSDRTGLPMEHGCQPPAVMLHASSLSGFRRILTAFWQSGFVSDCSDSKSVSCEGLEKLIHSHDASKLDFHLRYSQPPTLPGNVLSDSVRTLRVLLRLLPNPDISGEGSEDSPVRSGFVHDLGVDVVFACGDDNLKLVCWLNDVSVLVSIHMVKFWSTAHQFEPPWVPAESSHLLFRELLLHLAACAATGTGGSKRLPFLRRPGHVAADLAQGSLRIR